LILPTKRLPEDRALLTVGADVLLMLSRPKTVSSLWEDIKNRRVEGKICAPLPFDWFILALCLLRALGAVDMRDGRLHRAER